LHAQQPVAMHALNCADRAIATEYKLKFEVDSPAESNGTRNWQQFEIELIDKSSQTVL